MSRASDAAFDEHMQEKEDRAKELYNKTKVFIHNLRRDRVRQEEIAERINRAKDVSSCK